MSGGKTSEGYIALNTPSHVRRNLHYPAFNRKLFRVNYETPEHKKSDKSTFLNHPLEHHPVRDLLVKATALEVAVGLAGGCLRIVAYSTRANRGRSAAGTRLRFSDP